MELREYGRILLRRWWLILLLPLLAGIFSFLNNINNDEEEPPPITYVYEVEYSVSFRPLLLDAMWQDPRLSAVQVSEYVTDDLTQVFVGSKFAEFVEQYTTENKKLGEIKESIRTAKAHRLVTLVMRSESAEEAEQLADAVKLAVQNDLKPFLIELWDLSDLRLELTDDSGVFTESPPLVASELNIPLRILLAFIAAIALTFALDYLDDSIRSRQEAELLVAPVLGEIPREVKG